MQRTAAARCSVLLALRQLTVWCARCGAEPADIVRRLHRVQAVRVDVLVDRHVPALVAANRSKRPGSAREEWRQQPQQEADQSWFD